ncbi:hypothetical protein PR202_ga04283 [Eleusine coracana subsp. coracana]|uniref:Uncharacterized protein n=1 Tax=Eleusine coracana subsp. coracana TaxID=191504 RepID=A0AAV5BPJ8_ELECO|nr:hypothetical protein PR202_ga04283 [Eleusine coracana subsp. coracana]
MAAVNASAARGDPPLLQAAEAARCARGASASVGLALTPALVGNLCFAHNTGAMWKLLDQAMASRLVSPLHTLALLTPRVVPNRREQPEAYRLYLELLSRLAKLVDDAMQLSQKYGFPHLDFGHAVILFIFTLIKLMIDCILEGCGSPNISVDEHDNYGSDGRYVEHMSVLHALISGISSLDAVHILSMYGLLPTLPCLIVFFSTLTLRPRLNRVKGKGVAELDWVEKIPEPLPNHTQELKLAMRAELLLRGNYSWDMEASHVEWIGLAKSSRYSPSSGISDKRGSGFCWRSYQHLSTTMSLSSASSSVQQIASLAATMLCLAGGVNLIRLLYEQVLPTLLLSAGDEKLGSAGQVCSIFEGFALAYVLLMSGASVWGVGKTSPSLCVNIHIKKTTGCGPALGVHGQGNGR